jgi:hypothetical protein
MRHGFTISKLSANPYHPDSALKAAATISANEAFATPTTQ